MNVLKTEVQFAESGAVETVRRISQMAAESRAAAGAADHATEKFTGLAKVFGHMAGAGRYEFMAIYGAGEAVAAAGKNWSEFLKVAGNTAIFAGLAAGLGIVIKAAHSLSDETDGMWKSLAKANEGSDSLREAYESQMGMWNNWLTGIKSIVSADVEVPWWMDPLGVLPMMGISFDKKLGIDFSYVPDEMEKAAAYSKATKAMFQDKNALAGAVLDRVNKEQDVITKQKIALQLEAEIRHVDVDRLDPAIKKEVAERVKNQIQSEKIELDFQTRIKSGEAMQDTFGFGRDSKTRYFASLIEQERNQRQAEMVYGPISAQQAGMSWEQREAARSSAVAHVGRLTDSAGNVDQKSVDLMSKQWDEMMRRILPPDLEGPAKEMVQGWIASQENFNPFEPATQAYAEKLRKFAKEVTTAPGDLGLVKTGKNVTEMMADWFKANPIPTAPDAEYRMRAQEAYRGATETSRTNELAFESAKNLEKGRLTGRPEWAAEIVDELRKSNPKDWFKQLGVDSERKGYIKAEALGKEVEDSQEKWKQWREQGPHFTGADQVGSMEAYQFKIRAKAESEGFGRMTIESQQLEVQKGILGELKGIPGKGIDKLTPQSAGLFNPQIPGVGRPGLSQPQSVKEYQKQTNRLLGVNIYNNEIDHGTPPPPLPEWNDKPIDHGVPPPPLPEWKDRTGKPGVGIKPTATASGQAEEKTAAATSEQVLISRRIETALNNIERKSIVVYSM